MLQVTHVMWLELKLMLLSYELGKYVTCCAQPQRKVVAYSYGYTCLILYSILYTH